MSEGMVCVCVCGCGKVKYLRSLNWGGSNADVGDASEPLSSEKGRKGQEKLDGSLHPQLSRTFPSGRESRSTIYLARPFCLVLAGEVLALFHVIFMTIHIFFIISPNIPFFLFLSFFLFLLKLFSWSFFFFPFACVFL
jgi:hypothetical protein